MTSLLGQLPQPFEVKNSIRTERSAATAAADNSIRMRRPVFIFIPHFMKSTHGAKVFHYCWDLSMFLLQKIELVEDASTKYRSIGD